MLPTGRKVIVLDGAMGSEIEKLRIGGVPEDANITHAEQIKAIHRAYSRADIITTNTFGLNRVKYKGGFTLKEVALKAVENARAAGKKVFFDIGPTGAMIKPLGTLTFDGAYSAFAEIVDITKDMVDGYIAETFSDLYEIKACVLAIKEHSDKPVFATVTFDKSGRTLTGSTPEIAANTLQGLGADALGVNCSAGPADMEDTVKRLLAASSVPVIVQPNCGLPEYRDGKTVYSLGEKQFAEYIEKFVKLGVSVVGGCCGTTPAHVNAIAHLSGAPVRRRKVAAQTVVNSATKAVTFDGVKLCGERLNPAGKKKYAQALLNGDYDYVLREAVNQAEAGADILDLNVGVPGLDEPAAMLAAVQKIQEYVNLPLQIDSSDAEAAERGARYCNGIPIINSVNGEREVADKIFPIAKKYGAVVLGLTMDKNGIPPTARGRFEIAKRIVAEAERHGIPRNKIIIDTLTLTVSAEQKLVGQTLEALRLVKTLGVKTALGVSNVSFGLPNRGLLNATFLTAAMACGLDMPIANPLDKQISDAVKAYAALSGADKNCEKYIEAYKDGSAPATTREEAVTDLYGCILKGLDGSAERLCKEQLKTAPPMAVVNGILIKALGEVGELYAKGALFLPQLVASAEAAKKAFAVVTQVLPEGAADKGTVVLATVRGDVHDIGKNIVKVVLQSYGYAVADLGKDVPPEEAVNACKKFKPKAIGLSALMTTTIKSMEETVSLLKKHCAGTPVFVGGAVLNAETAKRIGADYFTADALQFVRTLEKI